MTGLQDLGGAGRPDMADIGRARNIAIEALDEFYTGQDTSAEALAEALKAVICQLRAGA